MASDFRIIGDEIEYEFRPFAKIIAPPSVLRDCAEAAIDSVDAEAHEKELAELEADLEKQFGEEKEELEERISDLEGEVSTLEEENADLRGEIEIIEICGGLVERVAELKAEAAKWQSLAETYGAKLRELQTPAKRKPKR